MSEIQQKMFNGAKIIFKITYIVAVIAVFTLYASAYSLEVGIPGKVKIGGDQSLVQYISNIYQFALAIAGIAAFGSLVYAGILWIISAAVDQKKKAMEQISNALLGLGLVLGAFLLLQTINPDLVNKGLPGLSDIKGGGSGVYTVKKTTYICDVPTIFTSQSGGSKNTWTGDSDDKDACNTYCQSTAGFPCTEVKK